MVTTNSRQRIQLKFKAVILHKALSLTINVSLVISNSYNQLQDYEVKLIAKRKKIWASNTNFHLILLISRTFHSMGRLKNNLCKKSKLSPQKIKMITNFTETNNSPLNYKISQCGGGHLNAERRSLSVLMSPLYTMPMVCAKIATMLKVELRCQINVRTSIAPCMQMVFARTVILVIITNKRG